MSRFENGWFRLERRVIESDIAKSPLTLALWLHLLGMANIHETNVRFKGKQIRLQPGSLVTGVSELVQRTGIPRGSVQRNLKYLEETGRIQQSVGTQGRIITICNWAKYQLAHHDSVKPTEHERYAGGTPAVRARYLNEQDNNQQRNNDSVSDVPVTDALSTSEDALTSTQVINPKGRGSRSGPLKPDTPEALFAGVPSQTLTRWKTLYDDDAWLAREAAKAIGYYVEDNPEKCPKTVRGWCRAFSSWLERGWREKAKTTKGNGSVSGIDWSKFDAQHGLAGAR